MKLTYRGVSYDYNPSQALNIVSDMPTTDIKYRGAAYRRHRTAQVNNLNAVLTYRGATYRLRAGSPVAEPATLPNAVLTYRGINYQVQPNLPVESAIVAEAPVAAVMDHAPVELSYRGTAYRLGQAAKAENLNAVLKYRGVSYQPQDVAEALPAVALKYRGAAYNAAPAPVETVAVATPAIAATPVSVEEQARQLTMQHQRFIKNRQQVMLSRIATEVGLDTIGNYWNRIQGKVHPSFRVSYDRSHVALS